MGDRSGLLALVRRTCGSAIRLTDQAVSEGFDPARILNLCRSLSRSSKLRSDHDFARLGDVLFLHDYFPSRDAFCEQYD